MNTKGGVNMTEICQVRNKEVESTMMTLLYEKGAYHEEFKKRDNKRRKLMCAYCLPVDAVKCSPFSYTLVNA